MIYKSITLILGLIIALQLFVIHKDMLSIIEKMSETTTEIKNGTFSIIDELGYVEGAISDLK